MQREPQRRWRAQGWRQRGGGNALLPGHCATAAAHKAAFFYDSDDLKPYLSAFDEFADRIFLVKKHVLNIVPDDTDRISVDKVLGCK